MTTAGRWTWLAAGLGALAGCATPRMAPPADVTSATEVLSVSGRKKASGALVNEGFELGSYTVANVDRKANKSRGGGVGPWSKETKTTGYRYELVTEGGKLAGECSSKSKSQGVSGFSWGSIEIACSCDGDDGKALVTIVDDARSLELAGEKYQLEPIHSLENGKTSSKPAGFRVDEDGVLGAVEVTHPGQVWLKKGLDESTKAQAACVFVGLMLYLPPSD